MLAFNVICQLRCVICSIKRALRGYTVRKKKMECSSNLTSAEILHTEAAQGQSHKCILAFLKCHYSSAHHPSVLHSAGSAQCSSILSRLLECGPCFSCQTSGLALGSFSSTFPQFFYSFRKLQSVQIKDGVKLMLGCFQRASALSYFPLSRKPHFATLSVLS